MPLQKSVCPSESLYLRCRNPPDPPPLTCTQMDSGTVQPPQTHRIQWIIPETTCPKPLLDKAVTRCSAGYRSGTQHQAGTPRSHRTAVTKQLGMSCPACRRPTDITR